jgi:proline racemase/trans-L-3-hydroxyproline dehydratase
MRFKHVINVIDTHTEGEPTRIIISGIPHLEGQTIGEKKDFFK